MIDNNTPKVSVVIPSYNAASLIGKTIQSVTDQTFSDWEIIVVDDCSTDETKYVVEALAREDDRIKLKTLDQNFGGPAGPRNVGVGLARGDFVAFLDADDIWHPKKLEIQLQALNETQADFACSQMRDFTDEESIKVDDVENFSLEFISFQQQSVRARIPTSSVIARRDLLSAHPFNEDISYKAVEDYHCWLRLLQNTKNCVKIEIPLLYYRKIEGQISGSKLYMLRKVFMVHRQYPNRSRLDALIFTFCHVFGGIYSRFIKKVM